jgi:hypothetical protein
MESTEVKEQVEVFVFEQDFFHPKINKYYLFQSKLVRVIQNWTVGPDQKPTLVAKYEWTFDKYNFSFPKKR